MQNGKTSGVRAPIIQQPHRQTKRRRWVFALLTLGAWAVWIYLWLPLLTSGLWLLGVRHSHLHLFGLPQDFDWRFIAVTIVLAGFVILAWARYNILRYGELERRSRMADVDSQALFSATVLDESSRRRLRRERSVVIYFCEKGSPCAVDLSGEIER